MSELDLKSLCELTGVSPRTVHFYIHQRLLPPARGVGRGARYTDVHRDRLRLIRELQDQHLPLAEIRRKIEGLSSRELSRLADRASSRAREATSAADYISAVLSGTRSAPAASGAALSGSPLPATAPPSERSQWERIVLAPEIELHVRRPLSRVMNRKLDKLLEHAREVMKEHV
jgi:DNA-binding transcriptional MerR regulator